VAKEEPCGESPKKRDHKAVQDGELEKGDCVDDDLGLGVDNTK
jgi:hypothetical protein